MSQNAIKIYQAPLQGATDFDFRKALAESFGGIDKYFIPYLSYGKGREIKKSQLREVFPENNESLPVIPQVLFSDQAELFEHQAVFLKLHRQDRCPGPCRRRTPPAGP